jgi:carbamoyltransferase
MMNKTPRLKTGYIAAIARGHNAGVCLLKDGEIVFSIEEERLSRQKYDGGPYASMMKILEYTDKIDYLVIAHTQRLNETAGRVDYTGDDVYTGLARKLGLISRKENIYAHPQVIDLSFIHHKLHSACAFYRSGFDSAVSLIVDGAGTFINISYNDQPMTVWEVESIIDCEYPSTFKTRYKNYGTSETILGAHYLNLDSGIFGEQDSVHEAILSDRAGIVKTYEGVTEYCGFSSIEAGKTMGLFPYGKENTAFPKLFDDSGKFSLSNRNLIVPNYPNGAKVNSELYNFLDEQVVDEKTDVTHLQSRRDLAYAVQTQTQEQVLKLIYKAVELTGKKQVVLSGGYGLNCVANYYYLEQLRKDGIELYVEPISNDAGTAIGAGLMFYHQLSQSNEKQKDNGLYLGPAYTYTEQEILEKIKPIDGEITDVNYSDIVKLLREKNIVAIFQGRSENGPRALGNRSILFDPTFEDGKDFVNNVKRREYFRPFAGTIIKEMVHEWFDLRGKDESPHMMYAVNCKSGVAEKIPSIIHVDGTCRIQTVTEEQNYHFYQLIKEFYNQTNIPIIFNTSFNLGGDPLVETLDDAIDTLIRSDIEYLYLPEHQKLIKITNV